MPGPHHPACSQLFLGICVLKKHLSLLHALSTKRAWCPNWAARSRTRLAKALALGTWGKQSKIDLNESWVLEKPLHHAFTQTKILKNFVSLEPRVLEPKFSDLRGATAAWNYGKEVDGKLFPNPTTSHDKGCGPSASWCLRLKSHAFAPNSSSHPESFGQEKVAACGAIPGGGTKSSKATCDKQN